MFQFHNGSIKTNYAKMNDIKECLFQFHNGSIKTKTESVTLEPLYMFQFHNGSIKTHIGVLFVVQVISCFNSTMVRLKLEQNYLKNILPYSFNSTMVRLKHGIEVLDKVPRTSFNSTMVRLKLFAKSIQNLVKTVSIPQWFD